MLTREQAIDLASSKLTPTQRANVESLAPDFVHAWPDGSWTVVFKGLERNRPEGYDFDIDFSFRVRPNGDVSSSPRM